MLTRGSQWRRGHRLADYSCGGSCGFRIPALDRAITGRPHSHFIPLRETVASLITFGFVCRQWKSVAVPTPDLPQLDLVLGGARSGKSRYAERMAMRYPSPWTYIATAQAFDDEMLARIRSHRQRRGDGWATIEAPLQLTEGLIRAQANDGALLIDCLTLWLSNVMHADRHVDGAIDQLCQAMAERKRPLVVVSNEVGLGIVPDNPLARRFRDAQGRLNQRVAGLADRVTLMVAGLPLTVKPAGAVPTGGSADDHD